MGNQSRLPTASAGITSAPAAVSEPAVAAVLRRPWAHVGTEVVPALAAALPAAIDATLTAIRVEVPSYAEFGSGAVVVAVRRGVEIGLQRWLSLLGTEADALDEHSREVYQRIGAGEWRSGRSLEALLAAYRTGARVSWEHWSAAAVAAGAGSADIVALAEAIFVYIDELSAASAAGYAEAQMADAGRREALRSKLLAAILDGSADSDSAQQLAAEIGWQIPARAAVALAWAGRSNHWPRVAVAAELLVGEQGGEVKVAVVPDFVRPSSLALGGVRVVVGPTLPVTLAPESLRAAERLNSLVEGASVPSAGARRGTRGVADGGVRVAEDYLLELAASADPLLVTALRDRVLGPVLAVANGKREVLLETLRAWLVTGGDRAASARWLHVHPQTVSYRVNRLRELLGERLDDHRARQEMILVLAAGVPASAE